MKQPGSQKNPWLRAVKEPEKVEEGPAVAEVVPPVELPPSFESTPHADALREETPPEQASGSAVGESAASMEPIPRMVEEVLRDDVSAVIEPVVAEQEPEAVVEGTTVRAIHPEADEKEAAGSATKLYSSVVRAMEESAREQRIHETPPIDNSKDEKHIQVEQDVAKDEPDHFISPVANPFGDRRERRTPAWTPTRKPDGGQRSSLLKVAAIGLLLLAAGAGGWWWWTHRAAPPAAPAEEEKAPAPASDQRKVLYWYDPMMPQQHFDKPGPSPFMDMELVPMYADEAADVAGVKIDSSVTQNLGVRLATVEHVPLSTEVEVTGLVGFNDRDVALVQTRAGGFVERVWPLAPGDLVSAGQPLVELMVPDWAGAQYELLALKATGDIPLIAAARDRLRLLGMPEEMITKVERSGMVMSRYTVTAPSSGLIQSLDVRTGMTVMAGQNVARLNGLSKVWLEAAVPEASAGLVRVGSAAQVRLAGFHGGPIEGEVTAILPMLNEVSRSLRVRIELPNRDGRLRPGLSAQVLLKGGSSETALAVPTEAVIRTGKRTLVMVALGQGRYAPVEVSLGREIGDKTTILSGLNEGQQVVASGQFLIDSEASLKGIEARTKPEAGAPSAEHGEELILNKAPEGAAAHDH